MLLFNNLKINTVTQSMLIPSGLIHKMESQKLPLLLLLLVLKKISPSIPPVPLSSVLQFIGQSGKDV